MNDTFSEIERDYASEILSAWMRHCGGSQFSAAALRYWGNLYADARDERSAAVEHSGCHPCPAEGHLDDSAGVVDHGASVHT